VELFWCRGNLVKPLDFKNPEHFKTIALQEANPTQPDTASLDSSDQLELVAESYAHLYAALLLASKGNANPKLEKPLVASMRELTTDGVRATATVVVTAEEHVIAQVTVQFEKGTVVMVGP
jgi:hypothetical protein